MFGIEFLETIEKVGTSLSDRILTGLLPEVYSYWVVGVSIYVLWYMIDRGLFKGEINKQEVFRLFMGIILIQIFLSSSALYHEWLFDPIRNLGFKFTEICIRGASFSNQSSIRDLMTSLNQEMEMILNMANAVGKDTFSWNIMGKISWAITYFLSWFLWFLFFAAILEYQFCFTVFAAIVPLAFALSFFTSTRSFATQIFRLPLFGALVMGLSSLAMSFIFEIFRSTSKKIPIDKAGNIAVSASEWTSSLAFHEMILGMLIGSFLLTKAHALAGKIAQFEISVGANVGFAAMAAAGKTAMAVTAKGVGAGVGKGFGAVRATHQSGSTAGLKVGGSELLSRVRGKQ